MTNPKVSVVIPSYNHEKYIQKCIESVINQNYGNLEIVIIDDGSSDSTPEICEKFAKNHSNINFTKQKNEGAHNTINKAISNATGEFIAVLNSDDEFAPNKINNCIKILETTPDTDLIFGNIEFINAEDEKITEGVSTEWQNRSLAFFKESKLLPLSILNENFATTTSNMFFRKSLWEKNNKFQALRYCHDLDFIITSFRNGKVFFDQENTHVYYRTHNTNTIKEAFQKVQIEVGAVLATTIVLDNTLLINDDFNKNLKIFKLFLENKNISNLVLFLITLFAKTGDRIKFYELIMKEETKSLLIDLLNNN